MPAAVEGQRLLKKLRGAAKYGRHVVGAKLDEAKPRLAVFDSAYEASYALLDAIADHAPSDVIGWLVSELADTARWTRASTGKPDPAKIPRAHRKAALLAAVGAYIDALAADLEAEAGVEPMAPSDGDSVQWIMEEAARQHFACVPCPREAGRGTVRERLARPSPELEADEGRHAPCPTRVAIRTPAARGPRDPPCAEAGGVAVPLVLEPAGTGGVRRLRRVGYDTRTHRRLHRDDGEDREVHARADPREGEGVGRGGGRGRGRCDGRGGVMSIRIPVALAEEIIAASLAPLRAEMARLADEVRELRRALPPLLVTQPEAAKRLGVSLSTIQRRVKAGELPCVKIGKSVRVDFAALRPLDADAVARLAREARSPPHLRVANEPERCSS